MYKEELIDMVRNSDKLLREVPISKYNMIWDRVENMTEEDAKILMESVHVEEDITIYKEKLLDCALEDYLGNKLSEKTYSIIVEGFNYMTEGDVISILHEIRPKTKTTASVAGSGAGLAGLAGGTTASIIGASRFANKKSGGELASMLALDSAKSAEYGKQVGANKAFELLTAKKFPVGATAKVAASGAIVGAALYAAYRGIRAIFDKCSRSCGAFALNTFKRQICLAKCNVIKAERELDVAKKTGKPALVSKKETALIKAKENLRQYHHYATSRKKSTGPEHIEPGKFSLKVPK